MLLATLITVVFTVFQLDLWLTSNKLPKWSIFDKKEIKKLEKSATLFIDPGSFPFPQTDVACDAEFNGNKDFQRYSMGTEIFASTLFFFPFSLSCDREVLEGAKKTKFVDTHSTE